MKKFYMVVNDTNGDIMDGGDGVERFDTEDEALEMAKSVAQEYGTEYTFFIMEFTASVQAGEQPPVPVKVTKATKAKPKKKK